MGVLLSLMDLIVLKTTLGKSRQSGAAPPHSPFLESLSFPSILSIPHEEGS